MTCHCSVTSWTCLLHVDVKHAAVRSYDQHPYWNTTGCKICRTVLTNSYARNSPLPDQCQQHLAITSALYKIFAKRHTATHEILYSTLKTQTDSLRELPLAFKAWICSMLARKQVALHPNVYVLIWNQREVFVVHDDKAGDNIINVNVYTAMGRLWGLLSETWSGLKA